MVERRPACCQPTMRDVCHAVVNRGTRWRRCPVNSDGQGASHREQWTRSPECLAGAGNLELWRHCVTRLQVHPVGVQTEAMLPSAVWPCLGVQSGSVDRVSFVLWSGFGRCAGLVRRLWTCHVM